MATHFYKKLYSFENHDLMFPLKDCFPMVNDNILKEIDKPFIDKEIKKVVLVLVLLKGQG